MRLRLLALVSLLSTLVASAVFAIPDIVFVTQPPHPADFATANATFGNHRASVDAIPRGGDLYIRYANGTLKNITLSAGYGVSGFQNGNAIAVRDPAVHWSGTKILFSMVVGAPTAQYQVNEYRWQLYEVTGIGAADTPVITIVPNQPTSYNNVMGTYGTDDRIIFVSDRPRNDLTHTYPQRDEYESTPTNTGLWSLDPMSGDLIHLDHSPSGDFHPIVDSFGRVIFTRWDHLQRDQQNRCSQPFFEAFNFASEDPAALPVDSDAEVFPEERALCEITDPGHNLNRHSFNLFLPWQMNEDGTELETINHIGRHELTDYIEKSFTDDPNVEEFYSQYTRVNNNSIDGFFQIQEDPLVPGTYFGISAPEFGTHASGQIIKIHLAPGDPADQTSIVYITHPDTQNIDATPSVDHIGLSRDPLKLSDGILIAALSTSTLADTNTGTGAAPASLYNYRLRSFATGGTYATPTAYLTPGIVETISYWSPDQMVTYTNVTMWELQPREIRVRTRPAKLTATLPAPEAEVLSTLEMDEEQLRTYLRDNNLALIVSRNVTTRDNLDHQQPLNLKVAGSDTETIKEGGKVYEVAHLQIFQGDLIRGYGGIADPDEGRRVLAQNLHSVTQNPDNPTGPAGSVKVAADGSIAALVPAQQALTYQLTDPSGVGVVRERLWLTFQPGEIRVCASCHGVNSTDQIGGTHPENPPLALSELLQFLRDGAVNSPAVSLRVTRKASRLSTLRLKFRGTGTNEYAPNKQLTLALHIGKTSCGQARSITTDDNGDFSFTSRRMPNVARKTKLRFSLRYNLQTLDQASYRLTPGGIPVKKSRLCNAVRRALR